MLELLSIGKGYPPWIPLFPPLPPYAYSKGIESKAEANLLSNERNIKYKCELKSIDSNTDVMQKNKTRLKKQEKRI